MKTWKHFVVVAVILFSGVCSIYAQDLIVLRDGNMIEAKIVEISPSEIRYKRFDNLDGPTIVLPVTNVLSIRYENGTSEIFNANTTAGQRETAINPDKLTVGIIANPSGLLLYGPSISVDFSKGNFTSQIDIIIPYGLVSTSGGGIGFLSTFNYLWHSRLGGFYLGGGLGYIWEKDYHQGYNYREDFHSDGAYWDSHLNTFGLNIGYKFVTKSDLSFRTGVFAAVAIDWASREWSRNARPVSFYIKPDIAVGYSFR
jgi:hypothetical protein